jgi:SAM-dependent methyltransferase
VRTDYELLARRYDEDRAAWSLSRDDVIGELLASCPIVRVLDLGCGTGRWLAAQRHFFADSRVELLGADPSSAMLAEARAKRIANIMRARAEDLPLSDAAIDYVVSSYAFHHFSDKDRALDEVGRVLTASGVFRITNFEPTAADGYWVYEFFPETIAIHAVRFWPPERTADALETRGFAVEANVDADPGEIPAGDALADAERRVLSHLALLDDDAYARGLAHLRQAAAVADATVPTTYARLRVTARRPR